MRYIKLPAHIFEDDKIKTVRSQKDGDSVILLYIMLMAVAVKSDNGGRLMLCDNIPYDDKILSNTLSLQLPIIKSGLESLVKYGLLTVSNSIYSLSNYDEYADMKTIKERRQNAERQAKYKSKQSDNAVMVTDNKAAKTDVIGDN